METSESKKGAVAGGIRRSRRRIFDCVTDIDKLLAENILSRLPTKSILQCRFVCKSWYHLIKTSKFVSKHLLRNHTTITKEEIIFTFVVKGTLVHYYDLCSETKVFLFKNLSEDKFLSPMSLHLPSALDNNETIHTVIGSVNGLICVSIAKFKYINVFNLILFNPSIGHSLSIFPPLPQKDPLLTCCIQGFGFDETTQDYKILLIPSSGSGFEADEPPSSAVVPSRPAFVYSLNSNSWTSLVISPAPFHCDGQVVFVNGCIHWLGYHQRKPLCYRSIWVFDLKSHTFRQISLPKNVYFGHIMLFKFGGENDSDSSSLAISSPTPVNISLFSSDIWLLKNYALADDESPCWIKFTTVYSSKVYGFIDNDHLLVQSNSNECLLSYNIHENQKKKKLKNNLIYPDYSRTPGFSFTHLYKYVPSIALLDKPNNIDATFVHVPPSPDDDNIAQTPKLRKKLQLRRSKRTRKLPA